MTEPVKCSVCGESTQTASYLLDSLNNAEPCCYECAVKIGREDDFVVVTG